MSTTESTNGTKVRYETILNNIRKQAAAIREANEKLRDLKSQLIITEHPAPAQVLEEAATTIGVALAHVRDVFREF